MPGFRATTTKALTANATQTLLQLQPGANRGFKVRSYWCSFDAAAAAAGIRVQLVRQTTAGTGASSPPTPQEDQTPLDAATVTVTHNHTAEPTLDAVLESTYVSPFGGILRVQFPLGQEPKAEPGGNRIAIRVITPAGVSPNADCGIDFEE